MIHLSKKHHFPTCVEFYGGFLSYYWTLFVPFSTCLPFSNEHFFKSTAFAQQLCKKDCTFVYIFSIIQWLVMVALLTHNVWLLSDSPHMEKSCWLKTMHQNPFFFFQPDPFNKISVFLSFCLCFQVAWLFWQNWLKKTLSEWSCCDLYYKTYSVPLSMLWYNLSQSWPLLPKFSSSRIVSPPILCKSRASVTTSD